MNEHLLGTALSRRRFVTGAAMLGAGAALGFPGGAEAREMASNAAPEVLSGDRFVLRLDRMTVNKTGKPDWGNAINGGVPGPVLRWREGDVVTLDVTNNLPEVTGVHWHGIILPNDMDGVPGLEFAGIQPGETYTYRFPVLQTGSYWYHSHMGYQEQKGAYGALIIEPRGPSPLRYDRDHVILLSDWMDGDPYAVQNDLKHMSDYWNYNRRTLGTFIADSEHSGFGAALAERWRLARARLDPSGLAQPSGALYTYLMNGQPPAANWTGLFEPGERVRLRLINGSAITYYDVRIPGLTMEVVQVHGNDVEPVMVDQLRIGVAETYDVIVHPTEDRAYTIFAEDFERSGYARGTLATRLGMTAAIPAMDPAALKTTTDLGMPMMAPDQVAASNPDRSRLDGVKGHQDGMPSAALRALRPGHQPMAPRPSDVARLSTGVEEQHVPPMTTDRLALPGDGLNELAGQRRILTYADLRSVAPGRDKRPPDREIVLNLTGNMQRFVWGFNDKKFSEVGPIDVRLGERIRIRFINDTPMSHPIHLHGMWMELENGGGDHRPYLHTVSVKPGENVTVLVTPVATGQWPLHCHVLYHFEAGMFRTLRVLPA